MAVLTGKSGGITFSTGYTAHCSSWTIEFQTDVFEDTELGDTWRTKVVGINAWSGSYDCAMDEASMTTIGKIHFGSTDLTSDTATFSYAGGGTVSGSIMITGATLNTSTSAVDTITFTFRGDGAPAFT
jgi:hypothetical protein